MPLGESLPKDVERALRDTAREWKALQLLVLFGSAARGRLTADSDVDLYARLAPGQGVDRAAQTEFVARAERACRRDIHLVVEQPGTSVILRREVASKGRTLFERAPGARRAFVAETIGAYVDLEPQLRKIGRAIRTRALAAGAEARERLPGGGLERGR